MNDGEAEAGDTFVEGIAAAEAERGRRLGVAAGVLEREEAAEKEEEEEPFKPAAEDDD